MNKDELYFEIEDLIIRWNIDGTKTAGSLTRQIIKVIEQYDNLDKQKQKVDELLLNIKKIEDEFLNDPNISEETKKGFIEDKKRIEEKFKAEEEEYQKWLERNKGKKIIGYNPENFKPIFEDEQP